MLAHINIRNTVLITFCKTQGNIITETVVISNVSFSRLKAKEVLYTACLTSYLLTSNTTCLHTLPQRKYIFIWKLFKCYVVKLSINYFSVIYWKKGFIFFDNYYSIFLTKHSASLSLLKTFTFLTFIFFSVFPNLRAKVHMKVKQNI